ncbi:helix-turn-helix domain-containing protein [Marilutibacter chinensis]|uniref:Helix-turn-helix domain-containing protein n=1 Tax=Marilutibacter chinensis TaxID=2912247 RepID=A0ABS9HVH3_9GAMM|nr:helix-turn-helix transcriptional regulator [Lysobacter chinensis]MCF7222214.1 helix-turn-helix domain-containing protein [Lysobacter chinensis]
MPSHDPVRNLTAAAVFSKRLKQAREMAGVSQRELGALIGLGKSVGSTRINRYEQQTSLCDMETAATIAKQLGVPLPYLFTESDLLAEMILAYSKLPLAEQRQLLGDPPKEAR